MNATDFILHHDVEMLPNGNILVLVWERIYETIAESQGSANFGDIYTEKLMEINPITNSIIW